MPSRPDDPSARLDREPAAVECPICRHRQWVDATPGRCDQCGSTIELFADRDAARAALDALADAGRVAYLREVPRRGEPSLFAVVANRAFEPRD